MSKMLLFIFIKYFLIKIYNFKLVDYFLYDAHQATRSLNDWKKIYKFMVIFSRSIRIQ